MVEVHVVCYVRGLPTPLPPPPGSEETSCISAAIRPVGCARRSGRSRSPCRAHNQACTHITIALHAGHVGPPVCCARKSGNSRSPCQAHNKACTHSTIAFHAGLDGPCGPYLFRVYSRGYEAGDHLVLHLHACDVPPPIHVGFQHL